MHCNANVLPFIDGLVQETIIPEILISLPTSLELRSLKFLGSELFTNKNWKSGTSSIFE